MSRSGMVQGPIEAPQMASGDLNNSSQQRSSHTELSFYANCASEAVNKCAQINVHHSPLHSKRAARSEFCFWCSRRHSHFSQSATGHASWNFFESAAHASHVRSLLLYARIALTFFLQSMILNVDYCYRYSTTFSDGR